MRIDLGGLKRREVLKVGRATLWFWMLALLIVLRPDSGPRLVQAERPRPSPSPSPHALRSGQPRRTNLLIMVADDHRAGTLGVDGDPHGATPRLDALARQGARFTRAFCNAPLCTASRQSFITGKLPHAVGVTRLTSRLPEKAVTLGDWLVNLGYETAAFGKMHFNSKLTHGFRERVDLDDWETWLAAHPPTGGDHRRTWKPFRDPTPVWLNAECRPAGLPEGSLDSTFFADEAIDYIRVHQDKPFALVVGFYDPHAPFQFPNEMAGRFRADEFPIPAASESERRERPNVFRGLTGHEVQGIQAAYYSSIAYVDQQAGRILDAIDKYGLADDTVVVYLGDNGYLLGEHGRFEKHCFYDQAVRVPLLIRWNGHIPAGRKIDGLVELIDLFPTVVSLLGIAPPSGLQGRSLVPLLKDEPGAVGRDIVFSEYLVNEEAMVRSTRYKLVVGNGGSKRKDGYDNGLPPSGPYQHLYDLENDPGETTDVSARPELSSVKTSLLSRLHERLTTTREGVESVPPGLSEAEAIHWCLISRDPQPTAQK